MFGYIRPFKPEMKMGEFELYKAVYCGLCRELGRSFGWAARLTLSYDFTFLAMLHGAVGAEAPSVSACRCCVNPFKKVKMCATAPSLSFSADVAALMIYYKHLDNLQDSRGIQKLLWHLLTPFVGCARKKAAHRQPEADALLADAVWRQQEVENARTPSIDAAAEPSAAAMAGIFALLSAEPATRRILERMGYLLGRYVYICDALDDWARDHAAGGYNPLLLVHGGTTPAEQEALRQAARDSLFATAAEIAKACDLLALSCYAPIIENIIHLGLRAGVQDILARQTKSKALSHSANSAPKEIDNG